jgi:hypothetical protein
MITVQTQYTLRMLRIRIFLSQDWEFESFALDARTLAGGEIQSDGYDSSKPTRETDEPLEKSVLF